MKKHFSYLLWMAFTVGFILLFAFEGRAATLPIVVGNGSKTFVLLRSGSFQCPAQQLLPPTPPVVAPAYIDVSCLGNGVRELIADGNADIYYRGATTSHVAVPALPDMQAENVVYAVSTEEIGTWINLTANGSAFVFAAAYGIDGTQLWSKVITFSGWSQVSVPVTSGLFVLRISASDGFGHKSPTAVHGFVTYGLRDGGSDTVIPLD